MGVGVGEWVRLGIGPRWVRFGRMGREGVAAGTGVGVRWSTSEADPLSLPPLPRGANAESPVRMWSPTINCPGVAIAILSRGAEMSWR